MRDGATERQGRLPRTTTPAKQSPPVPQAAAGYRSDSDFDDESDWDFGVGNLVIDLDADIEKTKASNNNNTLSSNNNLAPSSTASPSPSKANKMSSIEHQATVDNKAGIKMKIKRKNPSAKSSEAKHEIIKNEGKSGANSPGDSNSSGGSPMEKSKSANNSEKEKSKGRSVHGKKVKDRNKAANSSNSVEQISNGGNAASYVMSPNSNAPNATSNVSSTANVNLSQVGTVSVELDRIAPPYPAASGANPPAAPAPAVAAKKEAVTEDPYEFNVNKVEPERPLGFPVKKIKVEKAEMAASPITSSTSTTASTSPMQDAGTETCHVGTVTEPECLGPCEPGTSVTLEGIVWQETENGVLVVNVTWRGKTYVGTLLDATKHDWAPPRFSCDSPTSDFEARTPKGRGKRRAAASNISLNENSLGDTRKLRKGRSGRANNVFAAPPSPAKSEASVGGKRKGRPVELELKEDGPKASKRCRSNSRGTPNGAAAGDLIECPEPNCNKKYKHINGLRYHQTHAHQNSSPAGEENNDEEMKEVSSEESAPRSPSPAPAKPEKPERSSKKGKKNKQANPAPPPPPADAGDLDDDDKPLSQISGASPKKKVQQEEAGSATGTPSKDKSKAEGAKSKDNDKKEKQSDKNNASVLPISGVSAPPQVSNTSQSGQASNQSASTGSTSGPTLLTVPEIKTEPRDPTSEKSKKKGDKEKKNKSGASVPTVSRPLMPAPASVPVTSVAASHSQLPNSGAQSNLKPIQPKSAAVGEPASNHTAVPPVKRPKKKRKQDKDAPPANPAPAAPPVANSGTPQSQQLPVQMHQSKSAHKDSTNGIKEDAVATAKAESMSVIKTLNSSPLKLAVEPDNRTREQGSKLPPDITKSVAPGKEPMDLATKTDSRMARPPSSLSVNSPVQMSSESRDHNEDAQSPAYSDISDESAPTLEIEGAKPVKEEKMSGVENSKPGDRAGEHGMTNPYGMYYYGQPPYLIPAVPQQQGSTTPNSQSSGSSRPSPKMPPSATVTSEKDPMMMEIKQEPGLRQNKELEHENSAKKDAAAAASHKNRSEDAPNRNLTPSSVEYQQAQQQKMMQQQQQQQQQQLQQQMYGMSPYYYNYGIDPQYHMQLMASDPVYRQQHEKMVEQEKRRHQESKEGEKQRDRHLSSPSMHSPGSRHPQHGKPSATVTNPNSGSDQPHSDKRASPSKPPLLISERDRKMRELEKQNENHQILKENIELKNQMPMVDKSKYEGGMPYENEQQALRERQAEELQRYYLYQQQQRAEEERRRMMEHHKPTDLRKDPNKDKQSTKDVKEQDSLRDRRPVDMHRPKEGDMKRPPMEKVKGEEDRGRQGSPSPRTTPKLKEGGAGPQSSTPNSMPTTYGQYLTQQAYLPSSHYTGIPSFDPSHPMYRAGVSPIIGYAGAPYLHPHQMRYMAGMEGVEKEKALASPGSASSTEPPSGKALEILQQHAAYYSPGGQHKIHELTEIGKARDLSNSSPAKGSDRSTPSADKTRSPPPQRHLHTHHHTHVVNPGYPLYDPYGGRYT